MKKLISLSALIFILSSCGKESPSRVYREFQTERELEFIAHQPGDPQIPVVSEGENLVFKYTYAHEEDKDIADDELSEIFYLEIPVLHLSMTVPRQKKTGQSMWLIIDLAFAGLANMVCKRLLYLLQKSMIISGKFLLMSPSKINMIKYIR